MSNTKFSESCYLCNSDSNYIKTDNEKRRHYLCSNESCGEYEISLSAMEHLIHNNDFKSQLLPLAKRCKGTDGLLQISVRGTAIEAKVRPRSEV
ncbi:MAG: hypothetical protein HRT97_01305 [Moritella sp.]|uniref:hypothetical protein n=1 Tax=Moritella sp. TaxID=78556 RepID=UPI0025FBFAA7|nr:hypothetical protein [Moritella sp.]NQZ90959.1 hypothetical protein [Moritella sp.]